MDGLGFKITPSFLHSMCGLCNNKKIHWNIQLILTNVGPWGWPWLELTPCWPDLVDSYWPWNGFEWTWSCASSWTGIHIWCNQRRRLGRSQKLRQSFWAWLVITLDGLGFPSFLHGLNSNPMFRNGYPTILTPSGLRSWLRCWTWGCHRLWWCDGIGNGLRRTHFKTPLGSWPIRTSLLRFLHGDVGITGTLTLFPRKSLTPGRSASTVLSLFPPRSLTPGWSAGASHPFFTYRCRYRQNNLSRGAAQSRR